MEVTDNPAPPPPTDPPEGDETQPTPDETGHEQQ